MPKVPLTGKAEGLFMLISDEWAEFFEGRKVHVGGNGYATFNPGGGYHLVHRYVTGCEKGDGKVVDHINHNRLDNRLENLRVCTNGVINSGNHLNRKDQGVYFCKYTGRFRARVEVNHKVHELGRYDTYEQALAVVRAWRIENHPGYPGGKVQDECGSLIE